MDKNYFATSFNNGLLKIYNDNFENRVPITIIKEFEVNEGIHSIEKTTDNSLLLVNNLKIKKIKFSDDFKEYKVINIIEKKDQLFKMAVEIGEINALLTTNDYNQIKIYDFENGKELYKNYIKDEILFMKKISENKIILQISKNNLMSTVNIDLERYSLFTNFDSIETLNENINSEIHKKEDKDINLSINEFEIINNEIKLKKNFAFEIGINYLGKIDEYLILLYDKLEKQVILFDINTYESVSKLFFNSSLKPITSLVMNKSIDSFDLLVLFEDEMLAQCVLN
jgi:desulfoferrodoxin (superoxide reductase-like protein)